MKVSLNWIKEFTDVNLPVDELVEKIGAQLGGVEEVIDIGKKYAGIVIAKVISCVDHQDSDHLHVCKIDDGGKVQNVERDENGYMQVVCGAPEVHEGMMVAWIPPGAIVPSTFEKEPLTMKTREIRGVRSAGMLGTPRELAVSDDHSGLLMIDEPDAKPGDNFAKLYGFDDHIIDIENKMFTHRPDCFGQLGVAREIAGIQGQPFTSPDWYVKENGFESSSSDTMRGYGVENRIPELCPRYMLVGIDSVKIQPSPMGLQSALSRVGIRPINNIVDMTNYIMMLTGQPLHAFDFDKVAEGGKAEIVVRKPAPGEKLTLLGDKTIEPRADAILICDQDKPIALGGVMGGNNSEIDENTTRILMECAAFDMYNIRRTAMEHGIFTEAVTRFTKGQSSWQCAPVLYKAIQMAIEVSPGAKPIGHPVDVHHAQQQNQPVQVSERFINKRLGLALPAAEMAKLLTNVEFKVDVTGDSLNVTAPFWRTDIEIPEDIVEEVGRLYGYDHLPLELPRRSIKPAAKNAMTELKDTIRSTLAKAGANELLTYSFVHGNLLDKVGQDRAQAFQIANALSPDLQYYRLSLTPSLLDKVHSNIKAGYDEFALFEIGKGHNKEHFEDDLPKETEKTALVMASAVKAAQSTGAAYYQARRYLDELCRSLGLEVKYEALDKELDYQTAKPFDYTRSAHVVDIQSGLVIGIVGEFRQPVLKALKLPPVCAGFEISTAKLLTIGGNGVAYTSLPRFPKVEQDICLKVAAELPYQELFDFVSQKVEELKPEQTRANVSPIDIYQRDDDTAHKQITLRLSIASFEKTMTDPEVAKLLEQVAAAAQAKLGAERI